MTKMTGSLEEDAIALIEHAGGKLKPGDLYKGLQQRGHESSPQTLRAHLLNLSSVKQDKDRGPWTLKETRQGDGTPTALSNFVMMPDREPGVASPPLRTSRNLPLEQLSWEDFELLCVHLLDERCNQGTVQPYGLRGQNQLGIDVLGVNKATGDYEVIQCKRYQSEFGEHHLEEAVSRFLDGSWKTRAKRLILAITQNTQATGLADKECTQREILKKEGVEFEVWDNNRLTRKLKDYPHLIDMFFGPEWARRMGQPDQRKRVYLLDATTPLEEVKSDNSQKAFSLATFKNHTVAKGRAHSANLHDVLDLNAPAEWERVRCQMKRTVRDKVSFWSEEDPDVGIAVFPFARVSLLFSLGLVLGDQKHIDLYRWERDEKHWRWKEDDDLKLRLEQPQQTLSQPKHVAILVCVSTSIHEAGVQKLLEKRCEGEPYEIWRLEASDDKRGYNNIHHPEQLVRFKRAWRDFLQKLDETHGSALELHLFISAAAPVAVAAGQSLPTRSRPRRIHLHEYCSGEHYHVLTV